MDAAPAGELGIAECWRSRLAQPEWIAHAAGCGALPLKADCITRSVTCLAGEQRRQAARKGVAHLADVPVVQRVGARGSMVA